MEVNYKIRNIEEIIADGLTFLLNKTQAVVAIVLVIMTVLMYALFYLTGMQLPVQSYVLFWFGAIIMMVAIYASQYLALIRPKRLSKEFLQDRWRVFSDFFSRGLWIGFTLLIIPLLGLIVGIRIFGINSILFYLFGVSVVSFFSRIGGGLFAKGADMASHMMIDEVSDVGPGDIRNAAVVADYIGDHLGNSIAVGVDLVESFLIVLLSVVLLMISDHGQSILSTIVRDKLLLYPILLAFGGTLIGYVSGKILTLFRPRCIETNLVYSIYLAAVITMLVAALLIKCMPIDYSQFIPFWGFSAKYAPFLAICLGLILAIVIGINSDYFTSSYHHPTRNIASFAQYNAVISILMGMSYGMFSSLLPILFSTLFMLLVFKIAGIYGVIMLGLGLLSVTSVIIGANCFAPFADNAFGIAKVCKLDSATISNVEALNSMGNTTVAFGKSFSVGSVLIVSFTLFILFIRLSGIHYMDISVFHPLLIASLLAGGMLPFLFAAVLLRAVSYTSVAMLEESKRQFLEIPFLKEGKVFPNVSGFVELIGFPILKRMIIPSVIVICIPIAIGIFLGKEVLAAVLFGSMMSGIYLSIHYSMTGESLDHAKKFIEIGNYGGKGTPTYRNAVVADIFGDSLKDLIGPSINNYIKLMLIISIVIIPLIL